MRYIYAPLFRLRFSFIFLTLLICSCDTEDFSNPGLLGSEIENNEALNKNQEEIPKSHWMSMLNNKVALKDITLIGSEGSMTINNSNSLQRQNEGLEKQLEAGVRMFDFELKFSGETDDDLIVSDHDTPILFRQHMPPYAQLMVFPKYGEPFYFCKNVLPILESFLARHQTEVLFIYIHKSTSTNAQKFDETVQKIIQKRIRLQNVFGAETPLGKVRNKILVMQLHDKNGNSYLKHSNEQIGLSIYQRVTKRIKKWEINHFTGNPIRPLNVDWNKKNFGDFNWKMNRIKEGITTAQNEFFKNLFFITYTSGWSSTTSPKEVADNILPKTIQYIEYHMLSPTTSASKSSHAFPRFGYLFANFVTSENGKRLIDVCITQSILANRKTRTHNLQASH